jgi:hypothetical protein
VQVRKGKEYKTYTSSFARAYSTRLGKTINEQLLRSSNLIADFWYTSWVDGGKPDLDILLSAPFVKKERKALKQECAAYRHNRLIEKNLLISKQGE